MGVAVAATACLLGGGPVAFAASGTNGGKIRLFATTISATRARILITGAIGDYGVGVSEDARGKVDADGNFEKLTLAHGGFVIDTTALSRTLARSKPTINTTNCSVVFAGSAPTKIEDGTGAYTGISGTVTLSLTYAGIAKKTAKGCDLSNNGPTYGGYQSITGTGSVSFK